MEPAMTMAAPWALLGEDVLATIFRFVAAALQLEPPTPRGLAAMALVCRHWRGVGLGDAVAQEVWRALHWEHCRHTDPPLPDLVDVLDDSCAGVSGALTYCRRAVCSRARRGAAPAPVFFQARGRADQAVLVPADTLQQVELLRTSLAVRYLVLRFERSMPQSAEETELLSQEGVYDEAMARSYTAEGEYDSYPNVEFDRLVVEHAEPRGEPDGQNERAEAKAKQHADWRSLFGEQPADPPPPPVTAGGGGEAVDGGGNARDMGDGADRSEERFRLTTEEYRYVLFDWTLHPPTATREPEPELEPLRQASAAAAAAAAAPGGSSEESLLRPGAVWDARRAVAERRQALGPPTQTPGGISATGGNGGGNGGGGGGLSPAEEIGAALLFVQWKPTSTRLGANNC
jgi:hypothetical protein